MAKNPAAILYDENGVRVGVEDNALRVGADPVKVAVHANATVTTDDDVVLTGYGQTELVLFINVKAQPTGTTPTLQFTIQEVDPGDEATVIGEAASSLVFEDVGTQQIPFTTLNGGAVKVSWVLTGTTPSFAQVYTTVLAKQGAVKMMGVGVGASYPDPSGAYAEPAAGTKAAVGIDGFGNLMTRGSVLTDEDSYFDDFVQATLDPSWNVEVIGAGTSHFISSSILVVTAGAQSGSSINVHREGDYGPMSFSSDMKVDNRQSENVIYLGFSNEHVEGATIREAAVVVFDGPNLRVIKFQTMASVTQVQTTDVVLPNEGSVTEWHHYTVEVGAGYAALAVDGVQVAKHKTHIPGPYAVMNYGVLVANRAAVTLASRLYMDNVMFRNHNAVEISGHFTGDSLRVELAHIPKVSIVDSSHGASHAVHAEEEGDCGRLWTTDSEVMFTLNQMLFQLKRIERHLATITDEEIEMGDVE